MTAILLILIVASTPMQAGNVWVSIEMPSMAECVLMIEQGKLRSGLNVSASAACVPSHPGKPV